MSRLPDDIQLTKAKSLFCCIFDLMGLEFDFAVRGLMVLEDTPGLLSILAGKPSASNFPILSFSMTVRSPVPPFTETSLAIEGDRLTEALQYGATAGQKDLRNLLITMQRDLHGREKDASWDLIVGSGSQDLLFKAFTTLTDPGDVVLIEVRC